MILKSLKMDFYQICLFDITRLVSQVRILYCPFSGLISRCYTMIYKTIFIWG